MELRLASDRGQTSLDWLQSKHSFSFGSYFDPNHQSFRSLRVINEDIVSAGMGFSSHPHRDMEIITYVLAGALQHKDSIGNGSIIKPGQIQKMSAGRGVVHSEFNASNSEIVHFVQIWIEPDRKNYPASYDQKDLKIAENWSVLASNDGRSDSLQINQDALLYCAKPQAAGELNYTFEEGRYGWLQVLEGELLADNLKQNTIALSSGDGLKIDSNTKLNLSFKTHCHLMLFDLS